MSSREFLLPSASVRTRSSSSTAYHNFLEVSARGHVLCIVTIYSLFENLCLVQPFLRLGLLTQDKICGAAQNSRMCRLKLVLECVNFRVQLVDSRSQL